MKPSIVVFATGGTFDKVYFDANSQFHVGDPQAQPLLAEANITLEYRVESLIKKDSLDMTDEDRGLITAKVAAVDGSLVLITHGTDGMVATAKALAASGGMDDKTIVLVGAMQPARMRYSDAPFNLGFAVAAVQLLSPGIYIAMNGQIFSHDKVQKNWDAGRFEAIE